MNRPLASSNFERIMATFGHLLTGKPPLAKIAFSRNEAPFPPQCGETNHRQSVVLTNRALI